MLHLYSPPPTHPASRWVQLIWEWEDYRSPAPRERILPHGLIEISWNLRRPHRFWSEQGACSIEQAAIIGPRDRPYLVDTHKPSHLFGILFAPGAAADLFDLSIEELLDGFVPLDAIPQGARLQQRVGEADSLHGRRQIVLDWAGSQADAPQNRETRLLFEAWSDPLGRQRSVRSLREQLGISSPTLLRRTRRQLGLRPAQLRQLLMFRQAVEALAGGTDQDLATTALDLGFCDQPHLNRSFRRHAGLSPTQYAPLMSDHPFNIAERAQTNASSADDRQPDHSSAPLPFI